MKKTILLSLIFIILCSYSSKGWRIYFYNYDLEYASLFQNGNKNNYIDLLEEGNLIPTANNSQLYSYKNYNTTFIPGDIKLIYSLLANIFYEYPFQAGMIAYQNTQIPPSWFLEIVYDENLEQSSNTQFPLERSSQNNNLWTGTFKPNSINDKFIISFTYLLGGIPPTFQGDRLCIDSNATLASDVGQSWQLFSYYTDFDDKSIARAIAPEGLVPGKEYSVTWDAYNEILTISGEFGSAPKDIELTFKSENGKVSQNDNREFIFSGTYSTNNTISVLPKDIEDEDIAKHINVEIIRTDPDAKAMDSASQDYTYDAGTITFLNAGSYTVTASLEENIGYKASPIILNAEIQKLDVKFDTPNVKPIPFPADQEGGIVLSNILNIRGISKSDIIARCEPTFIPITFQTKENSVLPDYLYDQMMGVIESCKDTKLQVDGYYSPVETVVRLQESDNEHFNLLIPALSCSGTYQIVLSPGPNVDFVETAIPVSFYPNIFNSYGESTETTDEVITNINGIPAQWNEPANRYEIHYPIMKGGNKDELFNEKGLSRSMIYTPGLYRTGENDAMYVRIDYDRQVSVQPQESRVISLPSDQYVQYAESIDLSGLGTAENNTNANMHFIVVKNGAQTPVLATDPTASEHQIAVSIVDDEIPTSVDSIELNQISAPLYYNLQGVRVENPLRGLFIRVSGGKAEKIFVK